MTENGHRGKKVVELVLDSGVRVFVTPLSPFTRRALLSKLNERHPDPDPSDYESPIPGQSSPGAVIPADDPANPKYEAYTKAMAEANRQRSEAYIVVLGKHHLHFPDIPDLAAYFRNELEALRAMVDLPDDAWEAAFLHAVITSTQDVNLILEAAHDQLELVEPDPTEEDVQNAWRIFRPSVQGQAVRKLLAQARSLSEVQKVRD